MFVVLVHFEVREAALPAFLSAVAKQADDSLTSEEGCLRFDVCRDNEKATEIVLYEIYHDAGAFDRHLETGHFKKFDESTRHMVAKKSVRTLTLLEGAES